MNPELLQALLSQLQGAFGASPQLSPLLGNIKEFMDKEKSEQASNLNVDPLRDISAFRVNPFRGFLAEHGGEVMSQQLPPLPFSFLMPGSGLSLNPNPMGSIRNTIQSEAMTSMAMGGQPGSLPSLPAGFQLDTINNVPSNLPGGAPGKYDLSQLALQQNETFVIPKSQPFSEPVFGNKVFDRDNRYQIPAFGEGGVVELEAFIVDDTEELRDLLQTIPKYKDGGVINDTIFIPIQYSQGGPVHLYGVEKAIFGKIVKGIKKVAKGIGKGVAAVGKGIKDAALFGIDNVTNLALGMDIIKPGAYSYGFSKNVSGFTGNALNKIGDIAVPIAASFIGSPALGAAISGARGVTNKLGDGGSFLDALKAGIVNAGATFAGGKALQGAGVKGFGDVGKLFKGPNAIKNIQGILGGAQKAAGANAAPAAKAAQQAGVGFNIAPILGLAGAGAIGGLTSGLIGGGGGSSPSSSGSLFNRIARDVKAEEIGQPQGQRQPQSYSISSGVTDYNSLPPNIQSNVSNMMSDVFANAQQLGMIPNNFGQPQHFFFGGRTGGFRINPAFTGQAPQLPGMFGRLANIAAQQPGAGQVPQIPGMLGRVASMAAAQQPGVGQGFIGALMGRARDAAQQAQQGQPADVAAQAPQGTPAGFLGGIFGNLRSGLDQIRNTQQDPARLAEIRGQMLPQLQSLFSGLPILGGGSGFAPRIGQSPFVNPRLQQAMQMARPMKFGFQDGGEVQGLRLIPIQTEMVNGQPEMIVHLDGSITKVNATKPHKKMDEDEVTDIVPEGSYILSADKSMKMSYKQADDVVLGIKSQPYKEWKQGKVPTEITLAGLWGNSRKDMTPAQLGDKIKRKFNTVDKDRYYEYGEDIFTKRTNQENLQSRFPYLAKIVGFSEEKKGDKGGSVQSMKHGGPVKISGVPHAQFGLEEILGLAGSAAPLIGSLFGGGGGQGAQGQIGVSPAVQSGILGTIPMNQLGLQMQNDAVRGALQQAGLDTAALTNQLMADERSIGRTQGLANVAGTGLGLAGLASMDTRRDRRDTGAEQSLLRNFRPRSASRAAMEAAATPAFSAQDLIAAGPRGLTALAQMESDRVRNANQAAQQRNQYLDNFELNRIRGLNELTLGDQMFNIGQSQAERDARNQQRMGIFGTMGQGIQRGADIQTEMLRRLGATQANALPILQQFALQNAERAGYPLIAGSQNALSALTALGSLQGQNAALQAQFGQQQQAAQPSTGQQVSSLLNSFSNAFDRTPNAATDTQHIDPTTIQPANPGVTFQPNDPSQPLGSGFNINNQCPPGKVYIQGIGCV